MSPVAPSEDAVKDIIADLAAKSAEVVAEKSKGWPKEAADLGAKAVGLVTEQVNNFLAGDIAGLRDALVKDVVKAIQTGKGPVSRSFSDIA